MRYLKGLTGLVLLFSQQAQAGLFDNAARDVGKTIEKSVQDVGKSIEKGAHEVGKTIQNPDRPETEQSPSDPCRSNPQLPQCDGLHGNERVR